MENGKYVPGSYYFYAPNKVAPIVFSVLFFASTVWHFIQCVKYKSWRITGLFPFIGAVFTAGFITREIGAYNYHNSKVYIATQILLYMAPPILELAHYHVFGRLLYYIPYCSPIHPGRTLTTFGFLSSFVEILNGIGVAWTSNPNLPDSWIQAASNCLKASLILQICVIAIFMSMVITYHIRCARNGVLVRNVSIPLTCLYVGSALVLIRCIYRTIEHFSADGIGKNSTVPVNDWSPLLRYEWYFWVFEASLMFLVMILWNVFHPRKYLPENYHVYLARDGESEVIGDGWKDNRNFFVTVIDPFGIFAKNDKPFWEMDGIEPNYKMRRN